jgi:thiamine monophosphate synthase
VDILRKLARRRSVALVVDDDPAVCAAATAAGFAVFQATWLPADEAPVRALFSAQEVEGET